MGLARNTWGKRALFLGETAESVLKSRLLSAADQCDPDQQQVRQHPTPETTGAGSEQGKAALKARSDWEPPSTGTGMCSGKACGLAAASVQAPDSRF